MSADSFLLDGSTDKRNEAAFMETRSDVVTEITGEVDQKKGPTHSELVPPRRQSRMTPRDQLLLRDLGELRYLNTRQISRLHFGNIKLAQRRVRRLLSLGLVLRVPVNGGARAGFHEWLYTLPTRKTDTRTVEDRANASGTVLGPPRGPRYVAHHLGVTDFQIWLREAVNRTAGRFVSNFLPSHATAIAGGRRVRPAAIDVGSSHGTLIPDGVFALRRSDGRAALFFLEIDQGTEPLRGKHASSIGSKFQMYRRVYDARLFERLSEHFEHEFDGFRTLFIVPDDLRATRILEVAESADFSPLAWAATSESFLSPGDISLRIWRDSHTGELRSLDE